MNQWQKYLEHMQSVNFEDKKGLKNNMRSDYFEEQYETMASDEQKSMFKEGFKEMVDDAKTR